MAKKREVNKEQHYKSIINKQKSIIKKLAKKAGRTSKAEERINEREELMADLFLEEEYDQWKGKPQKQYTCPKCGAELDVIEGTKIKIFLCTNCNYKGSARV